MKIPTVRLVFDRKKAATKEKLGLVQMEICYDRKRKWISTGIKLYSDQWDDRRYVINSSSSIEYNEVLRKKLSDMEKWIYDSFPNGGFDWRALDRHLLRSGRDDNFVDFIHDTIESRNDIRATTKKSHMRLVGLLMEYGRITTSADLSSSSISEFDNWMHGRKVRKLDRDGNEIFVPMKQQTIYGYHKLMKTYIHIGIRDGYLKEDPYSFMRLKRGESDPGRFLNEKELGMLEKADMRSGCVSRARDMFVFQSYTGLSYADLKLFDFSKACIEDFGYVYNGKRKKSGEEFFFIILPKAMEILQKYKFNLPVTAQQSYNSNLKKAAADAGIKKPISSHWGRRTAAVNFINHGVRLEVVSKILGHASVSTTEQFYAQIVRKTVVEEMRKAVLEKPSNV